MKSLHIGTQTTVNKVCAMRMEKSKVEKYASKLKEEMYAPGKQNGVLKVITLDIVHLNIQNAMFVIR